MWRGMRECPRCGLGRSWAAPLKPRRTGCGAFAQSGLPGVVFGAILAQARLAHPLGERGVRARARSLSREHPIGYEFSARDNDCFVHVAVTGENTPDNVRGYLRKVYQLCARTGRNAVLIEENLTGPRLPPVDVYRIALEASRETAPVILRITYVDAQAHRADCRRMTTHPSRLPSRSYPHRL